MNKCKDCKYFKNDCGFSNVDGKLGLNGDFVACGQFVPSKVIRDCLSCSSSFSESCNNGDILHCMEQDDKIVDENEFCNNWN